MKYRPDSAVKRIVIHYTATKGDVDRDTVDKWHTGRGWSMIGYHYLLRLDGSREYGRDMFKEGKWQQGAGVSGHNSDSIHICYAGGLISDPNVGYDTRTEAQTRTMIALIEELLERFPNAEVMGHRDLAATECPGFDVKPWWAEVQAHKARPKGGLVAALLGLLSGIFGGKK